MPDFGPEVVLDEPAYIHPTAQIYGKVRLGKGVSLWPYTVIRAEHTEVTVGPHTNIQDFVVIHVGYTTGAVIGAHCSITHHCTIHGARIGDNCLIGVNATVMDECVIGDNCTIAGGAFVKEGTIVPDNSVVIGVPAKVVRRRNNWVFNRFNAALYHRNALHYRDGRHRAWEGPEFAAWSKAEMARLRAEFARLFPDEGTETA